MALSRERAAAEAWLRTAQGVRTNYAEAMVARVGSFPRNIRQVAVSELPRLRSRFREPDGVEMSAHQIFVGKIEPRRSDLT